MAIAGDKLVRATELAKSLSLEKSVKGAIKLVTALKLPILAERFSGILEVIPFLFLSAKLSSCFSPPFSQLFGGQTMCFQERLFNGCRTPAAVPCVVASPSTITNHVPSSSDTIRTGAPALPPSPLSCPRFPRRDAIDEKARGIEACKDAGDGDATAGVKPKPPSSDSGKHEGNDKKGEMPSSSTMDEGDLNGRTNLAQSRGPTNPFAKTASPRERASLLESIRKMKRAENEKDGKYSNKKVKVQKQ
ncbi:hypothetical protein BHE74_00017981 [Ensete ventricosum]|nr:hypothetical protein BHE74_00017981 [Ensete ventricosum]